MAVLYIDTCVFIAAFESRTEVRQPARRLKDTLAVSQPDLAVTSELTIAELLAPIKTPTALTYEEKVRIYLSLFDQGEFIGLIPISRKILMETTTLRRDHPQRVPDAIHIATAVALGCRYFVPFDQDAHRIPASLTWVTPTKPDVERLIEALHA